MQNNMFSIPEAASYSGVSRWTVWKYVRSGELNASRTPGGHYRIHKSDLEAFMREKGMAPVYTPSDPEKKILIVDDEPQIQHLYKKILSDDGYKIEIASNGFEAGTKILKFKPDVVILDLFMPGMDGFEVCKMIKESSETSHINVLIITGHDTKENKDRVMGAGADDFMVKPVNIEAFQKRVKTFFISSEKIPT